MRTRSKLTAVLAGMAMTVGAMTAVTLSGGNQAHAAGAVISTSSTVKTMLNSRCYHTHQVTVTTYFYSKTHGWTRYAAPKRTVTDSTTCRH